MKIETDFMNELEDVLVSSTRILFEKAGRSLTEKEARNVLGAIGLRIAFGSEVLDKAMFKDTNEG